MQTNNKLREALAKILGIADHVQMRFAIPELANQEISELKQIAEAALAEPVRNCEVGTPKEQAERWYWRYHVGHLCQSCPLGPRKWSDIGAGWLCFSEWLQMPYEEGGIK